MLIFSIRERFRGLYDTQLFTPHPQGLARRFDFIKAPETDNLIRFTAEQRVIKDEKSFQLFIDSIPKKVMDFVPTPPASNDPLFSFRRSTSMLTWC